MKKKNFNLPDWQNKTKLEKVLTIGSFALCIIVLILCIIQLVSKINLIKIYEPLLGITLLLGSIQYWKNNKPLAITCLLSSIYIIVISIIIIFK